MRSGLVDSTWPNFTHSGPKATRAIRALCGKGTPRMGRGVGIKENHSRSGRERDSLAKSSDKP